MSNQVDSSETIGIIGLVLQWLVAPLGAVVWWGFTRITRLEVRQDATDAWKKEFKQDNQKQHEEVMEALANHNQGVQDRLQSIEEHLRGRHNTG